MPLKILCAGCPAEEKERAESDVRRAFGRRAEAEAWMVSLVKMQGRWSVTLDGPATRGLTCLAPEGKISESILEAIGAPADVPEPPDPDPEPAPVAAPVRSAAPAPAPRPAAAAPSPAPAAPARSLAPAAPVPAPPPPAPAAGPGPRGDRHQCASCHDAFVVRYEGRGHDEGEETVAVACPHCWHRNYVLIGEGAAESREFTAEKA